MRQRKVQRYDPVSQSYRTHTIFEPEPEPPQRAILCGMMHAVDEGLANVTAALRATKRWDSTLVVFSKAERRTGCFGCAELTAGHWAQAPTTAALARAQEQTSHCVAKKVSQPAGFSTHTARFF